MGPFFAGVDVATRARDKSDSGRSYSDRHT
jgi:hypothetical protein